MNYPRETRWTTRSSPKDGRKRQVSLHSTNSRVGTILLWCLTCPCDQRIWTGSGRLHHHSLLAFRWTSKKKSTRIHKQKKRKATERIDGPRKQDRKQDVGSPRLLATVGETGWKISRQATESIDLFQQAKASIISFPAPRLLLPPKNRRKKVKTNEKTFSCVFDDANPNVPSAIQSITDSLAFVDVKDLKGETSQTRPRTTQRNVRVKAKTRKTEKKRRTTTAIKPTFKKHLLDKIENQSFLPRYHHDVELKIRRSQERERVGERQTQIDRTVGQICTTASVTRWISQSWKNEF